MGDVQGQGGQPRDPGGSVPPPGYTPPPQPAQQPVPAQAPVAPTPMTSGSGITFYEDDGKPLSGGNGGSLITPGRIVIVLLLLVLGAFVALRYGPLLGDGKIDDPKLSYSYEYPRNFREASGQEKNFMVPDNDVDVTVVGRGDKAIVVARDPSAAEVSDVTAPLVRAYFEKTFREQMAGRGGTIEESSVTTVADYPALRMEGTSQSGNGINYYFIANGSSYIISCQAMGPISEIEGACNKVVDSFEVKQPAPQATT